MSSLEVIGIVASCTRAFSNGADIVAHRIEAQAAERNEDEAPVQLSREQIEQEMLQKMLARAFVDGETAIQEQFMQEQRSLRRYGSLLREGDDIAKQELLFVAVTLQDEILEKIGRQSEGHAGVDTEALQSLYETAVAKRHEAIRSISQLRQRIANDLPNYAAHDGLSRKNSTRSMAQSFVSDAVTFSKHTPKGRKASLSVVSRQQHLIPTIQADDIESLMVSDVIDDADDRYTLAKAYQSAAPSIMGSPGTLSPVPLRPHRAQLSSSASIRAARAPESIQRPPPPELRLEDAGPYFPPRSAPHAQPDNVVPTLPVRKRDRPSVPESSSMARGDSSRGENLPWANRMFTNNSIPSPSSSPRISEPDSAISIKSRSKKPYCNGAVAAQEDFAAGFDMNRLPILKGADKKELCWICKECDFNASDAEGQLFERIEFKYGIRYRFQFLARSHVPYTHPAEAMRPKYKYGCQFCTAEGKQSAVHVSADALMQHVKDKHLKQLVPEVKLKTKCIVGKIAEKDEEVSPGVLWDCNLPEVGGKSGVLRNWMIHAVTSLPT